MARSLFDIGRETTRGTPCSAQGLRAGFYRAIPAPSIANPALGGDSRHGGEGGWQKTSAAPLRVVRAHRISPHQRR